jgi:hypothetical protein
VRRDVVRRLVIEGLLTLPVTSVRNAVAISVVTSSSAFGRAWNVSACAAGGARARSACDASAAHWNRWSGALIVSVRIHDSKPSGTGSTGSNVGSRVFDDARPCRARDERGA